MRGSVRAELPWEPLGLRALPGVRGRRGVAVPTLELCPPRERSSGVHRIPREDAQVDFMEVRFVPGWDPLDQAVERGKKQQLTPDRANRGLPEFREHRRLASGNDGRPEHHASLREAGRASQLSADDDLTLSTLGHRGRPDDPGERASFQARRRGDATEFRFNTSKYAPLDATAEKVS